jgi:hypothetical protein
VRRGRDHAALVLAQRGIDHHHRARGLDQDVLGLEVAVVGQRARALQLLQRAHDGQEPVEADALERADLLAQRLAAHVLVGEHGPALVLEALAQLHDVRVLERLEQLDFRAQQVVDLVHVEEVDAHAVLAEEDRLGRRLVGRDAFGPALVGDLEEARHVAPAAGDVAELERDLAALGVFGEVHQGEPAAREEFDHAVGSDGLACFQLDHEAARQCGRLGDGAWGVRRQRSLRAFRGLD